MNSYVKPIEIRWSDLDPNFHVTHSAYYDFGAYVRMSFLSENNLGPLIMKQNHLGPILFREECIFKRELNFGEVITINLLLKQCTSTYSRWTFQHEIVKNGDILCAVMTVDGAWMDTTKRKLTVPPEFVANTFNLLPRAEDFKWIEKKN